MSSSHLSKEFFELIRDIGESKSKQEEDDVISREIITLKSKLKGKEIPAKKMKELLLRMIYCEMLGSETSFGYINGVNMTQEQGLLYKRVGYLAVSQFLHEEHELIILLINSIQRDLKSTNHVFVCYALNAVAKLINVETIPAILDLVIHALSHANEYVRKKAIMVIHRIYQKSPSMLPEILDIVNKTLSDRDPSVMAASLHLTHLFVAENAHMCKVLAPNLISILTQIVDHRLPNNFDYHRTPAPWMQIDLLQILALLGADDAQLSESMYDTLFNVLRRADTGINIGFAVTYECIRTICAIYPKSSLVEAAAKQVGRFITSDNRNLRYMGIRALSFIVHVDPAYATEHQMVVIDCLEDSDLTLRKNTLALLFSMTNPINVRAIVDKLLDHLKQSQDVYMRSDLVSRITQLAERFAPDNEWFINTLNQVFIQAGDLVKPEVAHNLLRILAEGTGEGEDADTQLRQFAVRAYFDLSEMPDLSDLVVQILSWTLGEYAYVSTDFELDRVVDRLCDLMEREFSKPETRVWIVSALMKLSAQMGHCSPTVLEYAQMYKHSSDTDMAQRCSEILVMATEMQAAQYALPVDASCEDVEEDLELTFLDAYVQQALDSGASEYNPRKLSSTRGDGTEIRENRGLSLRFEAYERPPDPFVQATPAPVPIPVPETTTAIPSTPAPVPVTAAAPLSLTSTGGKWSAGGYTGVGPKASTPREAPVEEVKPMEKPTASPVKGLLETKHKTPTRPETESIQFSAEKQALASALFGGLAPTTTPTIPDVNLATILPLEEIEGLELVTSDDKVRVESSTVVDNNTCVHTIYVTNVSTTMLRTVNLHFEIPANFQQATPLATQVTLQTLRPSSRVDYPFRLVLVSLDQPLRGMGIHVSYMTQDVAHLQGTSLLSISHFLVPHTMTTEQYGSLWQSIANEQKVTVPTPRFMTSMHAVKAWLHDHFHFQIIQIIGNEAIAASQCVCCRLDTRISLIHLRFSTTHLDILIRSPHLGLLRGIHQSLGSALK